MHNLFNRRKIILVLADAAAILAACMVAFLAVNMTDFISLRFVDMLLQFLLFALFNLAGMFVFGVYDKMWRYANVRDFIWCSFGVFLGTGCYYLLVHFALRQTMSDIYNLFALSFTLIFVLGIRVVYSFFLQALSMYLKKESQNRTMIVGAGAACHLILQEIQEQQSAYHPVCIVDDDSRKISRTLDGIRVYGPTDQITLLCKKFRIDTILFAIPSCPLQERNRILNICAQTDCDVKILPYLHEIIKDDAILHQVKNIEIEDLLNRDPIELDSKEAKELIRDKICMVTGGGGSIGSELCRQIVKYHPQKLVIVDIYENNAYEIQQELIRNYQGAPDVFVEIATVRDYEKMDLLFTSFRPQLVFHAAAHKHVPLMETNPEEAVKNNVIGTYHVARLCAQHHIEKMILVSTDKAVNPTNVMGATKRCCEMIMQYMQQQETGTEFAAVRFGNVLGSNGSVVPLFRQQIEKGGPVTVTHKDIIRYFMTIPEAVSLILQAGAIAKGGEIFVLDMGDPVKITSLAENLIRIYGYEPYVDIDIVFTGLRPGEKLYEELLMSEEGMKSTSNQKIFIGNQIQIDPEDFVQKLRRLKRDADHNDKQLILADLYELVPTFHHQTGEQALQDAPKNDRDSAV